LVETSDGSSDLFTREVGFAIRGERRQHHYTDVLGIRDVP